MRSGRTACESPVMSVLPTDHQIAAIQTRITRGKTTVLRHSERLHADLGRVASDWKADGSRVTKTDHAISAGILADLAQSFPEDQGLSEELLVDEPLEVSEDYVWVLDPIDGTNNFAAGLAQCSISLALFHAGEPVYGILYDASRRQLIHGGPGFGVWDGDRSAQVRDTKLHPAAMVGFHSPHEMGKYPGHGEAMVTHSKVRAMGSSALHLAYVAVGLLEGVVDHNVKLWDIAAGIPLIRAAGGEVRFRVNNPLPLTRFDLDMPSIVYVGGCPRMCDDLEALLDEVDRDKPTR